MIDTTSPPGAWARFFAQCDGTPFTPLTEQQLESKLPSNGADKARIGGGGEIITHRGPTIPGAE